MQTFPNNPNICREFDRIWAKNRTFIFGQCLACNRGNYTDAKEVFSHVAIEAWKRIRSKNDIITFRAWVKGIIRNISVNYQKKINQFLPLSEIEEGMEMIEENFYESALDSILRNECNLLIIATIDALPPRLKIPSRLRFLENVPNRKIAIKLGISEENVRKRLQEARKILKQSISCYQKTGQFKAPEAKIEIKKPSPGPLGTQTPIPATIPIRNDHSTPKSPASSTWMIQVDLPNQVQKQFYRSLSHSPSRRQQKINTLSQYVGHHSGGWKKELELAELLYANGNWQEASKAYEKVLLKRPRLLSAALRLGEMYRLMGQDKKAMSVYRSAQDAALTTDCRAHLCGLMAGCQGHHSQSILWFKKAISLEPDKCIYWQALGDAYCRLQHPMGAANAYKQALDLDSNDTDTLIKAYKVFLFLGRKSDSEAALRHCLNREPNNPHATYFKLKARLQQGSLYGEEGQETRSLIRSGFKLFPETIFFQELQAEYHIRRGKWSKGIQRLHDYCYTHPKFPLAWVLYSQWLYNIGKTDLAAEIILRAYALDPNDLAIGRITAEILAAAGSRHQAIPILKKLLREHRECWSVWALAGTVYAKCQKTRVRAKTLSRQAVRLQPKLHQAWFKYGKALAVAGYHHESNTAVDHGLSLLTEESDPRHCVLGNWLLADNYYALNKNQQAQNHYSQVLKFAEKLIETDPMMGHYWQGKAYEKLHNHWGRRHSYRMAKKLNLFYPWRKEVEEVLRNVEKINCPRLSSDLC